MDSGFLGSREVNLPIPVAGLYKYYFCSSRTLSQSITGVKGMSISAPKKDVQSQSTKPDESVISVSQVLLDRRSVRAFSPATLDDVLVNEILQSAL